MRPYLPIQYVDFRFYLWIELKRFRYGLTLLLVNYFVVPDPSFVENLLFFNYGFYYFVHHFVGISHLRLFYFLQNICICLYLLLKVINNLL